MYNAFHEAEKHIYHKCLKTYHRPSELEKEKDNKLHGIIQLNIPNHKVANKLFYAQPSGTKEKFPYTIDKQTTSC